MRMVTMYDHRELLQPFRNSLVGKPLSHIWLGQGTALFMEFGRLTPVTLHDGRRGNAIGELGVMIEWNWRIENAATIICGSGSEAALRETTFKNIQGCHVVDVELVGRLPELTIALADNFYVSSFMAAEGDPRWALFDRCFSKLRTLHVMSGIVSLE
jgi:hypothetical protein